MSDTKKNKDIPKNTTRKRCPTGERRDKITNKCVPNKTKVDFVPTSSQDVARLNELTELFKKRQLKTGDLRNMVSDLIGEERNLHKNEVNGIRLSNDLIHYIVFLENTQRNSSSNGTDIETKPSPDTEPTVETKPSPETEPTVETKSSPDTEPTVETKSSPDTKSTVEAPIEKEPTTVDKLPNMEINISDDVQELQDKIGIEPEDMDSKEYNEFLFNKEKIEHENSKIENTYDFLYPDINDPDFSRKIALHKEFNDTQYDGTIKDIKKQSELLCNADFELLPHQMFVKNFLSLQTPYNSLLLYHGLGTGKTCSAIGIAEEMRSFMKQVGVAQKILIVASPNVQNNFRLQLFDERKLKLDGEIWNIDSCVGNSLLKEVNPTNLKGITKEKIISFVNSIINKYYSFVGYTELAHYIQKKTSIPEGVSYTQQQRKQFKRKRIKKYFDNRLIIIDEVHNIRQGDDNKDKKKTSSLLLKLCRYTNNMRFLLLSATPMYNSYKEIIWLTNLMNANDGRSVISESDIFDKNGKFIIQAEDSQLEGGRELLMRKLTGYVSFVRGENPYSFPYRIYPETFDTTRALDIDNYPSKQMNGKEIETPLQHIPIYTTDIGEYQSNGYKFIIDTLFMNKKTSIKVDSMTQLPTFANMESFGYTQLERPLQSLDIVYPNTELDNVINGIKNTMNPEDIVKRMVGKNGLMNVVTYQTTDNSRHNFAYKPSTLEKYGRIFSPSNISKYSGKISSICKTIINSTGVVIVYSQYIDGGVVPFALALEEMGFSRYGSAYNTKSLFSEPPTEPIDSLSMKPKSTFTNIDEFKPAKYVMITGDKLFSPDNLSDIKYITNPENKNGENVKVILITKAAAEGLDFKNVRQVHIMEPWYNMNRPEQIIGRGVRNLSHCGLPFEQRNVEIYLHGTTPSNDTEHADLYVYRFAEKKASLIGNVTRLMKEISVDCQLNIGQTNFTIDQLLEEAGNQDITIKLSSNPKEDTPFKIGDKPFTAICDYMEDCNFKCYPNATINSDDVTQNTYSEEYARIGFSSIVKRIRQLFKEQFFYKRDDFINSINVVKKFPKEQIDFAITRFVGNKNEIIVDKYGRNGYLINKGEYYVFQPMEITDEYTSLIERSIPIPYKRKSLELELPTKTMSNNTIIEQEMDNIIEEKKSYSEIISTLTQNILSATLDINTQINDDGNDTEITPIPSKKRKIKEIVNWYNSYRKVTHILQANDFTESQIYDFIIEHYIDTLSIVDKVTVINHIFKSDTQLSNDEKIIKSYFQRYINDTDNVIILFDISSDSTERIQIYTFNADHSPIWSKVERDTRIQYKNEINNFVVTNHSNVHTSIYGFMAADKKNNIVFKTRENNTTGSGFNCSSKDAIIKKINKLPITLIADSTGITEHQYCILYELLFRKLNRDNYKQKRWLFDMVSYDKDSKRNTFFCYPTR